MGVGLSIDVLHLWRRTHCLEFDLALAAEDIPYTLRLGLGGNSRIAFALGRSTSVSFAHVTVDIYVLSGGGIFVL